MRSMPKIKISLSTPICLSALAIIYGPTYILAISAATLLHELGHIIAIYLLGSSVSEVTVRPFGAVINRGENRSSYVADAVISLSGPAVNTICFLLCLPLGRLGAFASASLILALVNLIPSKPLDGYCAMRALTLSLFSPGVAGVICRAISLIILGILWTLSVYAVIYANFNIYLLLMVTFLICEALFSIK